MTASSHQQPSLAGARVDRIDQPRPGLYCLTLRRGGENCVLALAQLGPQEGVEATALTERLRGDAADGPTRGLREKLLGGRLAEGSGQDGRRFRLLVDTKALRFEWLLSHSASHCRPARSDDETPPAAAPVGHAGHAGLEPIQWPPQVAAEYEREILARFAAIAQLRVVRKVKDLRKALGRRLAALTQDQAKAKKAQDRAEAARVFVPAARKAARGSRELLATDWSTGSAQEVRFALEPHPSPWEQLEKVFQRAKRLKQGLAITIAREEQALEAELALEELHERLQAPLSPGELASLEAEIREVLPKDFALHRARRAGKKQRSEPSLPYRRYRTVGGFPIWVGKGAKHNDALTLRHGKPGDLWLHAKNRRGCHVLVPGGARQSLGGDDLADAATLAAHFSESRGEARVEVQICDRRYVQKRRGAAPGQVVLLREKVMLLRLEPERLKRLLASQIAPWRPAPFPRSRLSNG